MITIGLNTVTEESNTALGNHMFKYAACRSIAEKNGYKFFIPYGSYLKRIFPDIDLGFDENVIQYQISESQDQRYDPNLFNIPNNTMLYGYFQTDKYFQDKDISSWFKMRENDIVLNTISKYPIDQYCYIHIRGLDYKYSDHWFLPISYYEKAMSIMIDRVQNIKFVIITNDIEVSKEMFPNIDVISNDVDSDFQILTKCNYLILSNSSFAWWGAYLSKNKLSIAPNFWLNYNKPELGVYPIDIKTNKFVFI